MFLPGPTGVPLLVQLFHRAGLVRFEGLLTKSFAISLGLNKKAESHAGPSLISTFHENFKERSLTVPDSYGGVGGMRDLQMSYIFKKSLACFCAVVWCLVKNEALVSHLLLLLLVCVARQASCSTSGNLVSCCTQS